MSDNLISDSPIPASPVAPSQFDENHEIQFRCHKDVACFNACCKQIDITLTPYDIIRLSKRLGMGSEEFLKKHAVPFQLDHHGLPGLKLRTLDDRPQCLLMTDEGCSVYEDRPTACRYYPVGLMSQRLEGEKTDSQAYILVKEDHCLGHQEDNRMTVAEYRKDQGVIEYDDLARGWRQLLLKKMSSGPTVGKPSQQSLSLFFMACYNMDKFREFVNSDSFQNMFDLDQDLLATINEDDVGLLQFGFRFLGQVLYGDQTIPLKEGVADQRRQERGKAWSARVEAEQMRQADEQESAEKDSL